VIAAACVEDISSAKQSGFHSATARCTDCAGVAVAAALAAWSKKGIPAQSLTFDVDLQDFLEVRVHIAPKSDEILLRVPEHLPYKRYNQLSPPHSASEHESAHNMCQGFDYNV